MMRVSNVAHDSRRWRIGEIAPDFIVEDVWALPASGDADDFQRLLDVMASLDPANSGSTASRVLWRVRELLGNVLGLDRISAAADGGRDDAGCKLPIPGTTEISLTDRLPEDLRNTAPAHGSGSAPFVPLYRTNHEYAAELSNRTVHAVMHLAWVEQADGGYQGQMAVYVKPRGRFGTGYMAFIKPFRHLVVYPALMRQIEQAWNKRSS